MTRKNVTREPKRSLAPPDPRTAPRVPRTPTQSAYPYERRYAALQGDDEHPVDVRIDRIAKIAKVHRKARRLSQHFQQHVDDPPGFRDYEDLRLGLGCMREEAFFDAGHEEGRFAGRAESAQASIAVTSEGRSLVTHIRRATKSAGLPQPHVIALLLEIARALLLGFRSLGTGPERKRQRSMVPKNTRRPS